MDKDKIKSSQVIVSIDETPQLVYTEMPSRSFTWSVIPRFKVEKVIFNPPATIVYVNGNKYVSKVHEEGFDEEKGLLMCLAKAQGITHSELKRLIKNAKRSK